MWSSYPVLRPTIAALLGMAGVCFLLERTHFSIFITIGLLTISVAVTFCLFYRKKKSRHANLFGKAALMAFFFLGAAIAHWKFLNVESRTLHYHRFMTGVVRTQPVEKQKWWTLRLQDDHKTESVVYLAKNGTDDHLCPDIVVGDTIWVLSYFNMPTSPYQKRLKQQEMDLRKRQAEERRKNSKRKSRHEDAAKADSTNLLPSYDRRYYDSYLTSLFYKGIPFVAYSSQGAWGFLQPALSDSLGLHPPHIPEQGVTAWMRSQYDEAHFTEQAQAIMEAMTTGDKSSMPTEMKRNFSDAGISHVLALSGFHLTVIISLLDVLLMRGVFSRRWRRISALLVLPFIWAFVFIVGAPPSLVRAALMCSVFQIALVIGHGQQLKNAAAVAGFVMLIFNPLLIMDVGFQLSFLSIVGIAVMGAPLCRWCGIHAARWAVLLDIICISFTCSLFTAPVVAYHFGQVPLYGILSNLAVSLLATLFMWAAAFWWILLWWPLANGLLTSALNYLSAAMLFVAEKVASLPLATIAYRPNLLEVILLYLLLTSIIILVSTKIKGVLK